MRTKVSIFLCIIMLASLIAGCSNPKQAENEKANNGGSGPEKPGEQVTVTFWFPGADQANDTYFLNAAKEFEEQNPNIKIDTTVLPSDPQDIETKLNTAKLSGTFPDVFSAYLVFMGTRGSRGDFASLNNYIDNWDEKDDIFESSFSSGQYKGDTIGIGFFPAPEILTYRKDFFQEAGIDPNTPPTTWEQLSEYAIKLTKKDGNGNVVRAGMDIPTISPALVFLEPFMRQNGSQVIDEMNGVPAFNDDASIEALQYLVDLNNNKVSIPYNYQKKDEIPFVKGNAAMSFLQTSVISNLIKNKPELADQLGFAPVMERKFKVGFNGQRLFTIGNESKHKDEAWQFIEFMMSKEQMWQRYEELKIPVVRKSLESKFIESDPAFNEVMLDYVKNGKGKATVPWTSLANKYMSLAYEEALSNKKSAADALKEAQKNLEQELKNFSN